MLRLSRRAGERYAWMPLTLRLRLMFFLHRGTEGGERRRESEEVEEEEEKKKKKRRQHRCSDQRGGKQEPKATPIDAVPAIFQPVFCCDQRERDVPHACRLRTIEETMRTMPHLEPTIQSRRRRCFIQSLSRRPSRKTHRPTRPSC